MAPCAARVAAGFISDSAGAATDHCQRRVQELFGYEPARA